MSVVKQMLFSRFRYEERKLVIRWQVGEWRRNSDSANFIHSTEVSHHSKTPIKWTMGVDRSKKLFYLNPVDETVNKLFDYKLIIETTAPFYGVCTYDGRKFKCGLPPILNFYHRAYIVVELTYPDDAVFFCSCSIPVDIIDELRDFHLPRILSKYASREEFCDVQFMVQKKLIKAHKLILTDRSEVFYKMFTSTVNDPKNTGPIKIEDISYDGFSNFIDTIYFGKPPADIDICLEMIKIAEKYDVQDVKIAAEIAIIPLLNMDNAIEFLIYSKVHSATHLKKTALAFCIDNPAHKMTGIEELAKHPDLLVELLKELYESKAQDQSAENIHEN